jgi:uncharacterized repeat protein (TIGR03803 family)
MSSFLSASNRRLAVSAVALALLPTFLVAPALCQEKTLYKFGGGADGDAPRGALIADNARNLYGTTAGGGGGTGCDYGANGCGTVFELRPDGSESVLYAFTGGDDGAEPFGGLVADGSDNLYGTAEGGGASNRGTVFQVAPDGTETTLYAFQGGSDGFYPLATLLMDGHGDLFGTTIYGGSFNGSDCTANGCGTVFELEPDGTKISLYTFQGGSDGWSPMGALIADQSGNLYGTTWGGGDTNCPGGSDGCGIVYRIAPDGTEMELYDFHGGSHDGEGPEGGLVADATGNFYGTTGAGGHCSWAASGCGTVFRLAPDGTETVLHDFKSGKDGLGPDAGLVMDKKGNLYGTTFLGGGTYCGGSGCGTVFEITAKGKEKVLYAFNKRGRGRYPWANLLLGAHGGLYGTANEGGNDNNGVVFELKK